MTADPRSTARQWLADVIWQGGLMHVMSPEDIADAILTAPGVEVELDRIKRLPKEALEDRPVEIRNPRSPIRITHTQVVIRLPAEEGTGT